MPDTTNKMAAAGFARGVKTYQQRARTALPILVRQAQARQTIFYGELAHEMGIPNPRTLNYPLGSIGRALQDLGRRWGHQVPPIQALVINKSSGCPGEGFAFFAPDAKTLEGSSRRKRRLIVDKMLQDVFTFSDWDQVLDTFGLPPASVVRLPPADEILSERRGKIKPMQSKRDGLVPIGEACGGPDGPVKAIREASPQALRPAGDAVMPGQGRAVERAYTPKERTALGHSLPALGETTFDIHLNPRAFWCNVPAAALSYKLGGYQVLKKCLSYRERPILARPLTMDEIQHFTDTARRITGILGATSSHSS